jgi:hypothetical protein
MRALWCRGSLLCKQTKQKTNSVALSPQANYTDRATVACRRNLVPTFVDREVSRDQRGGFLDRTLLCKQWKEVAGMEYY